MDLPFIYELMAIAKKQEDQGLAYPCWDLKGNFEQIDKAVQDHLFIVENDHNRIGTVGIYDAPWGKYLVGPAVVLEFHEVALVKDVVAKMFDQFPEAMARIKVDVKSSNLVLANALVELGFCPNYAGVSMYYDLEDHFPCAVLAEVEDIYADDDEYLEQINAIFAANLLPWAGNDVGELRENIETGSFISALLEDGKVAGAIVWQWDDDSAIGEIEYICVGSQYQGKGCGGMLVDYVKNIMSASICDGDENRIYLDVDQTNTEARRFYESQGFVAQYLREVYRLGD